MSHDRLCMIGYVFLLVVSLCYKSNFVSDNFPNFIKFVSKYPSCSNNGMAFKRRNKGPGFILL